MTDDDLQLEFSNKVHSLDSVKRAAYTFTGRYSFDIRLRGDDIICIVSALDRGESDLTTFAKRFRNAVLDQDLRERIALETESVRNIILAHAFSKTGLQESD